MMTESRNLILIGMSGSGKTHWAKLLAEHLELPHIEIDELIVQSPQLAALLRDDPGKDAAERLGRYFGMPWSAGFAAREEQYLAIERTIMASDFAPGCILDLTGSAIYHPAEMARLKATGKMIYLETSAEAQQTMIENFIARPRPICWRGLYQPLPGENPEAALNRCYRLLLAKRAKLYESHADVTLPWAVHKEFQNAADFIDASGFLR
ncbi:MAG: hypothetical protein L6Q57_06290 [Alphaproteobacteria bacterium]|nr:hypothetical protein [Alphaproteobacteria bacterium]